MRFIQELPAPVEEPLTARKWFQAYREMRKPDTLIYEDAQFVVVDLPLRPKAVRNILPRMLRLEDPPTGTLIVADYDKVAGIAPYREALLLIHVKTLFGAGVHCCWIVLDDDTAIIYGREFCGYPKKWADIEYAHDEDKVSAKVSRRGVNVIEVEARRTIEVPPRPVFELRHFNAGGIGQTPWLMPIWCFKPLEIIKKTYEAELVLTLNPSHYDPIADFVGDTPETIKGRLVTSDIRGVKYFMLAGMAGFGFFLNAYNLRYR